MTFLFAMLIAHSVNAQTVENLARERITPHMQKFQACFLPDLKRDRTLNVKLKLKWTIDEAGNVIDAKVIETTKKLEIFEKCMLYEIKKITFEPEGIKYDFEYTFGFRGAK